ncbi:uncharacterized protein LOC132041979, partial [Lycium ferocissimum]|uniref:uncharacterized protein LOC132041979 n=1 Tax=Lycium ferocissimum TaxID=112874 RepID=UPI002815A755
MNSIENKNKEADKSNRADLANNKFAALKNNDEEENDKSDEIQQIAKEQEAGKIWLFWSEDCNGQVIANEVQQVTLRLNNSFLQEVMIIVVYANCTAIQTQELWDSVGQIARNCQLPWIVGGAFNVTLSEEEKLGGLPVHHQETIDFAQFINNCGLVELQFSGSRFTWWNGRIEDDCILKRLDRVLGNQEFIQLLPSSEVSHLIRNGSDHASLHVVCDSNEEIFVRPFRFLNFWTKHHKFMDVIKENWSLDYAANPFIELQGKMKKVKKALARWSKETYGNIFQQISTLEDVIKVKELQMETNPSEQTRSSDFEMLKAIPTLIIGEQNEALISLLSIEEVRETIYGLNGESTSGLHVFSRHFFQCCWSIVGSDVPKMVRAFFYGQELP